MNSAEIQQAIGRIVDPEIHRTLADLAMVKSIEANDNAVSVHLELPTPAYPRRERLTEAITAAVKEKAPSATTTVKFTSRVAGHYTGGTIGLKIANVIAVGSGKGGVGKSTVAATLAYGLQSLGARVGLMDADVYGPSIPHLTGATGRPAMVKITAPNGESVDRIEPVDVRGVKLISMGFFVQADQAVIWRGPMLHRAITQFLQETDWGELDYLIIDLPPGTGDVSLTLSQLMGLAGAVVVCTPQQVALLDAVKAVSMYRQVKIPLLGLVENMSGEMFGRGGARQKAQELGIPFLGEIPADPLVRIRGDEGRIADLFAEENPARQALLGVCEQTAIELARQLLERPRMPTLEIL